MSIESLKADLEKLKNPQKAKSLQRYFKTGPGEYAEGDIFYGLTVPQSREIAKKYFSLISLPKIQFLLKSEIHEERLIALEILNFKYENSSEQEKSKIINFYLKNTKNINNWDLVDTSAPYLLGDFLLDKKKLILYDLANSNNLWEKRIAIISTFAFIKENQFQDTLRISEILLQDKHDLIQKAVGWMLREIGKKDINALQDFLKYHYKIMPRTTLRYSIEKFPEETRLKYLKGEE